MKSKLIYRLISLITAAFLLLSGCSPAAKPAAAALALSASMSELHGKVELKNPPQVDFSAAQIGNKLELDGQVRTGSDGRARLDFSTGTIVRVAPNSMFTMKSNQRQDTSLLTRLKMQAGQLWIILRGGELDVDTPSGVTAVRGSFMSVWVDPDTNDVWVTCLEGSCKAENPSGTLNLISGEQAILHSWNTAAGAPPPPALGYLTQDDIDQFLKNNPEVQEVLNSVVATASALPTLTPTTKPASTFTSTPTFTPTSSDTPTATATPCVTLLSPADGSSFTKPAIEKFTWSDYPGASEYTLSFKVPTGELVDFNSPTPGVVRFIDAFQEGGTYEWWVTVRNGAGAVCTSGVFRFSKPETIPTPTPTPVPGSENNEDPSFWGRSGPKGAQTNVASLHFSVSTSLAGEIKVVWSQSNTSPQEGDSYSVIGTGPGTGSADLCFVGYTGTVYWRFAVYGSSGWILDSKVYSFSYTP